MTALLLVAPTSTQARTSTSSLAWTSPNGLRVLLEPTGGPPWIAVALAVHAGSRDDPRDRPGLAHLVEHLSAEQGRAEGRDPFRFVEEVGGTMNASTDSTVTVYYAQATADRLDGLLAYHALRLAEPVRGLTEEAVTIEREIVAKEMELRLSDIGVLRHRLEMTHLLGSDHPLTPSRLDEVQEIRRHTLGDARWFLETYYRPDNAALVVVGGFDPEAARKSIDRMLGDIVNPSGGVHRAPIPPHRPEPHPVQYTLRRSLRTETYFVTIGCGGTLDWGADRLLLLLIDDRLEREPLATLKQSLASSSFRSPQEHGLRFEVQPAQRTYLHVLADVFDEQLDDALREPFSNRDLSQARVQLRFYEASRASDSMNRAWSAVRALALGDPASRADRLSALQAVKLSTLDRAREELARCPRVRTRCAHQQGLFRARLERSAQ